MQLEKVGKISEAVGQLHDFSDEWEEPPARWWSFNLSFFYLPETAQTICSY